jgi:hypothetical protein
MPAWREGLEPFAKSSPAIIFAAPMWKNEVAYAPSLCGNFQVFVGHGFSRAVSYVVLNAALAVGLFEIE